MPTPRPIIVIADDLSGAAELAGLAAARGLSAEVHRQFDPTSTAHVIALDTDSRSANTEKFAVQIRLVCENLIAKPAHLFKKVDSVLRGHPRIEIELLLDALHLPRAILIPANPTRGRTIVNANYQINGIPLDQTHFARDEEFPRLSSRIAELLDPTGDFAIHVGAAAKNPPQSGIIVPDAASFTDLQHFASQINDSTLVAGAADFFSSMLDHWCASPTHQPHQSASLSIPRPALLVCGSLAAWRDRSPQCLAANLPVVTPQPMLSIQSAAAQLHQTRSLVFATLNDPLSPADRQPFLIALAKAAAALIKTAAPATLLIEGGATAAAVTKELNWQRFSVQPYTASGIGVLKPIGDPTAPLILIKPGSYEWPEEIWKTFCGVRD